MDSSRLLELSAIISKSIEAIHNHLATKELPFPTFDTNGSTGLPSELSAAQDAVIDATSELNSLLSAPMDLLHTISSHNNMVCLQAITRFNIARSIPFDEQVSFSTIAKSTGVSEDIIKRLLRHAITMRIFSEPEKGFVAHTSLSKLLAEPNTHGWMSNGCDEMWPAATKTIAALSKWPEAEEPNKTGFSIANNTTESLYQVLSADPTRARQFSSAMDAFSTNPEYDVSHVLKNYDWEALGQSTVVDIGGNRGHVAIPLATKFKNLNLVVQDMETAIRGAESGLAPEVKSRVKFMTHDMFTTQPLRDADVYYYRWIFHNWSDKYCLQILRNLIPALKPGARILIQEICVPQPGKAAIWKEKKYRSMDVTMLGTFNGKERDYDDWQHLFGEADKRFEFLGVKEDEGSALSFVEARWTE